MSLGDCQDCEKLEAFDGSAQTSPNGCDASVASLILFQDPLYIVKVRLTPEGSVLEQ